MKNRIIVILPFLLLSGCSKNDPGPAVVEMLVNGTMEGGSTQPDSWYVAQPATGISATWVDDVASSPIHSLEMSQKTVTDATAYSAFGQNYQGIIPVGKDLTFRVKIKGVNLQGPGISIIIRGDSESIQNLQFISTENVTSIVGTFDWTTYGVKLTNVKSDIKYIIVYMVYLPKTTGTVYFDDASLQHN